MLYRTFLMWESEEGVKSTLVNQYPIDNPTWFSKLCIRARISEAGSINQCAI